MTLKELINQPGRTLLDVRSQEEFQSFHVSGSINMPVNEIPAHLDEIKSFSKPLIIYCLSGGRSSSAVAYLEAQGINEIYNAGAVSDVHLVSI
ncbi:MAG TPA: rhodanese-like domain-containing protein [Edaphocola sp.]|nr:rhodanese-like domain-containing protein [Edaphocola sp.]